MHLSSFRVVNFKSFQETGSVSLRKGFNIVVGQNDAGKSTLAEALSTRLSNKPHRSLRASPERSYPIHKFSRCELEFELEADDLLSILRGHGPVSFGVPQGVDNDAALRAFIKMGSRSGKFRIGVAAGGQIVARTWEHNPTDPHRLTTIQYSAEEGRFLLTGHGGSDYEAVVAGALQGRIYAFKAERLNVSTGPIQPSPQLEPDARNLAGVLNFLQSSNVARFRRFCTAVRSVFPHITQITVPPSGNAAAQIYVWTVDPETEREDLAIPLSESGTGIGQVLAILYVVLTANEPHVIIIDEPQSFLHPGAVRKLIGILQEHPQHQYIITTHSPTVITAATPDQLLLVRRADTESRIETIDVRETSQLQLLLSEVGARLADVFGADNILWVEGQTEELCFPMIVRKMLGRSLFGTELLGILNTGDMERKHARSTLEIYKRLSRGRGLLPPAIGFIFDREQRSQKERDDLVRMSGGRTHFTPRRMYENYLLNPGAIGAVMSPVLNSDDASVDAAIRKWIEENKWDQRYFGRTVSSADRTEEYWIQHVDGATLLQNLFAEVSENTLEFQKTRHSVALTEWLLENSPADLQEIAALLATALGPDERVRLQRDHLSD